MKHDFYCDKLEEKINVIADDNDNFKIYECTELEEEDIFGSFTQIRQNSELKPDFCIINNYLKNKTDKEAIITEIFNDKNINAESVNRIISCEIYYDNKLIKEKYWKLSEYENHAIILEKDINDEIAKINKNSVAIYAEIYYQFSYLKKKIFILRDDSYKKEDLVKEIIKMS